MAENDDQDTLCEHRRIITFANDDASIRMWACEECRRRFYPACYVCIENGHRSGQHPSEPEPPALDVAWAEAIAALPPGNDLWLAATGPGFMASTVYPGGTRTAEAWSQGDPDLPNYDAEASPARALRALVRRLATPPTPASAEEERHG